MMDAVEAALTARGVEKSRVLIERFTTGPLSAAQAAAARAGRKSCGPEDEHHARWPPRERDLRSGKALDPR